MSTDLECKVVSWDSKPWKIPKLERAVNKKGYIFKASLKIYDKIEII